MILPGERLTQTVCEDRRSHLSAQKSDKLVDMVSTDNLTRVAEPQAKRPRNLVLWTLTGLIALGIFFRFYHIDRKEFWNDEVLTALHVSGGYPELYKERVFTPAQLQEYQKPHPDKQLSDTLDCLKDFGPEHSPFFYTIAYFWAQALGSSVAAYRALPAVLSIAAIGGAYWLALELSGLTTFALLAAAIAALSPMNVFFAQETREYSMLTAMALILSAAFLRAFRKNQFPAWTEYTLILVASVYTSLHTAFVLAAQYAYTVLRKGFKYSALIPLVVASIVAMIAFLPWLDVFLSNFSVTASSLTWLNQRASMNELVRLWTTNLGMNLVDFGVYDILGRPQNYASKALVIAMAVIQLVGLGTLVWKLKPNSLYLLLMIGLPVSFFCGSDIVFGGIRSEITRYMLPAFAGMLIAAAYLLYFLLTQKNVMVRGLGIFLTVLVLVCEIGSCFAMSESSSWIGKSLGDQSLYEIADEINNNPNPAMLISDGSLGANYTQVVGLSRYLHPDVRIQVFKLKGMPQLAYEGQKVYALNISYYFRKWLEQQGYKFEQVPYKGYLFVGSLEKKGEKTVGTGAPPRQSN